MPPETAKSRKEKERIKKREAGFVRKEIWVKPELWALILEFVNKIHKEKKLKL